MATFTVTTSTNFQDSTFSSRAGNDAYNINGGSLTIDTDTRYCTNATATSGNLGNTAISATLGGSILIDGTNVRIIPYSSGSGTVPAIGTTISKGGVSSYLLGVWSALNVAPTAAGGTMPASGWIKVKNVSGGNFSSGTLTGISATATGPDVVGWIEVIGTELTKVTCVRLGTFTITGAWFAAGTTNGSSGQTMQLPGSLANTYYAGVYVETAVGSGTYEFWPSAGTQTVIGQDQYRGKVVWISSQGLVTFGNNGTTTDGFTPVSGLKVVVPNINLINCTTAAMSANALPNVTLATRHGFTTTGGGVLSIDKCNMAWGFNVAQPYSVQLTNTAVHENITLDEIAQPISWSLVGVGQTTSNPQMALTMTLCFAGGSFTNCVWSSATLDATKRYMWSLTDINGFTFNNDVVIGLKNRGISSAGLATATRMNNCTFNNQTYINGQFSLISCSNLTFNNTSYIDTISGSTISANPMYLWSLSTSCSNITMDTLTFPLPLTQPYYGILSIGTAGCTNIRLRNLGTYSSPLDLGGPRLDDVTWTRSSATITVTSPSHGLTTTQTIYVPISSNVAAITLAAKVITVVDANTFTFTGVSSGTTSGTFSYYPAICANLFVLSTSAAASNIYVQRCYTPHTRTNLFTLDNSSKNIFVDNVISDFANIPLFAQLNGTFRSCSATPTLAAQAAVYGTHWLDYYEYGIPANTNSQAWVRSSTTITATAVGHAMRTVSSPNTATIIVTASSSIAAIPLGQYAVTVIDSKTFTFIGKNAGDVSGTFSFVLCDSAIALSMNEASADTANAYTIDAGTTSFTAAGSLSMPTIGSQITFETPTYMLGHTGFTPALPVMVGGTITNYNIYYAIDKNDGNGYSSFNNLYYPRTGATGTSGSYQISMTSTTGVNVGDYVSGTNVGGLASVVSVDTSTQITVNTANIGTVSGTIAFTAIANEYSIDPSLGFKIKWRLYTNTTNTKAITSLLVYTTSSDISRAYQYPLDLVPVEITVKDELGNAIQNARVAVYDDAGNQLLNTLTDASGYASGTVAYISDQNIDIRVRKSSSGSNRYKNNDSLGVVTASGFSAIVSLSADTVALP